MNRKSRTIKKSPCKYKKTQYKLNRINNLKKENWIKMYK